MTIRSHLQQDAWQLYRNRLMVRARAFFDFVCVDCGTRFRGTRTQAREQGWHKKWRRSGAGVQVHRDRCSNCRVRSRNARRQLR